MQSKEDVEKAFREDLKALLQKYSYGEYPAELEAKDYWQGYGECGEDVRITVDIPAIYSEDGCECLREYTEIDLGSYINPDFCC